MKRPLRTIGKWLGRGFLLLLLLEGLHITAIAYPFALFSHKERFDEFTVYSRNPIPEDFEQTIDDVRSRIEAMEFANPGNDIRIYLCDTQKLFSFFATLVGLGSDGLGIGLSLFDCMYLNETKIQRFAAANSVGIRHSRFEGNVAEVIAHEIAHFNVVDEIGFRPAKRFPFWKSEGYAEYQANLASIRSDPEYDFLDRIAFLQYDRAWGGNQIARDLFESHLLIEYLIDVEGYGLHDLVDEGVTLVPTRVRMLEWYEKQRLSG